MEPLIVGASHPYQLPDVQSIATMRGDRWAYSPKFIGEKLIDSTRIPLTGSRTADYRVAEARTGQVHVGGVTVWHHLFDFDPGNNMCTLQLVTTPNHQQTFPHAGGCSAYERFYNVKYQALPPEEQQALTPCAVQSYSARELEDFCARTALTLSPALRRFYGGDFQLNRTAFGYAARQDRLLDCILPLHSQEGVSLEQVYRDLADKLPTFARALAIGMDACGNYFCAAPNDGLLFYDHEQDLAFDTELTLQDLMR